VIDACWQRARRILAVRLDNLGDVLITTPAIHAVKAALPDARITLLASPVGAQAGRLNGDIAEVITYEAPWVDPWQRLPQDLARERAIIERLRAGRFDAAIIFTSFRQSPLPAAYLCYLAGIPLRVAASGDAPGSLLTTRHRHPETPMHEVERGLALVAAVGIPPAERRLVLDLPADACRRARRYWRAVTGGPERVPDHPLIVVHPGCSMPARTYPADRYVEVVDALVGTLAATVVLTGVDDERGLTAAIARELAPATRERTHDLAGALPFADLCALIKSADLVVTNNTGPMHVAAAVGTPVIALFALTNPPEQWGPWQVPHRVLFHDVPCRLCYHRACPYDQECLRAVTAAEVIAAASELGIGSGRVGRASGLRIAEPALVNGG
jgi:lipopolysaccharide heptosyltransferase II